MDDTESPESGYSGERLGLPAEGPGSMARLPRRVTALCIDWFAALLVAGAFIGDSQSSAQSLATLGIFAVQVTLLTWLWGSSFGQRLVGIRVVGRSRRLGLIGAALRTALICLVIPPLVWDDDGRGLHDRAVDSVVLRA